jgi:hypothetical protein
MQTTRSASVRSSVRLSVKDRIWRRVGSLTLIRVQNRVLHRVRDGGNLTFPQQIQSSILDSLENPQQIPIGIMASALKSIRVIP